VGGVRAGAENAPDGVGPIEWMLLTSEAALTLANAEERMDGYGLRWIIEEFHKSEKTGCRLERVQLKSAEAIKRWAALAAPVTGNVTIHADPIGRPSGGPPKQAKAMVTGH